MSMRRRPPPPTPPRHSLREWGEGSAPPAVLELCSADQALYLAKARGRNRVEVAPVEVSLGNEMPQRTFAHTAEQSAA